MRTLTITCLLLCALVPLSVQAAPSDQQAKPRFEVVVLISETFHRETTPDENKLIQAIDVSQTGIRKRNEKLKPLLANKATFNSWFLTQSLDPCVNGQSFQDCFMYRPVRRFLDLSLSGDRLHVSRYDYGSDGKYALEIRDYTVNLKDENELRRQALNLLICHAYGDEMKDAAAVSAACKELEVQPDPMAAWVPPTATSTQTVSGKEQPKPAEQKPDESGFRLSALLYWGATAGLAILAVPAILAGVVFIAGATINAIVTLARWSMVDGQAANAHLAPESGVRTRLAQARNNDLMVSGGFLAVAVMLIPIGIVLGVVAAGLTAYGTMK